MLAKNIVDSFIAEPKAGIHKKKIPEKMSDVEIKHKLCKNVRGGCKACDIIKYCKYGQQCVIRNLQPQR